MNYAARQYEARINQQLSDLDATDNITKKVKWFTVAELKELAAAVGVKGYGSKSDIAIRIITQYRTNEN